jgi:hypothetical protein
MPWQEKTFTHRLPPDAQANAQALAAAAHSRLRWPWLFVVIYSFLPISSDAVFTAVGMGALPVRSTVVAFFLARSIYNTLMVVAVGPVVSNLADLFAGRLGWQSILVVLLAAGGYVLFWKLPWARWLHVQDQRRVDERFRSAVPIHEARAAMESTRRTRLWPRRSEVRLTFFRRRIRTTEGQTRSLALGTSRRGVVLLTRSASLRRATNANPGLISTH